MKRALCLVLCVVFVCAALSGCTTLEKEDKGAVIDLYLANEIYNYDPAVDFTDSAKAKITSLLFEGLTTLNEKGKWQKAMMKDYEVIESDKDGNFKIQITLADSRWSDGRTVQADDFVYAWKRILSADFKCEAAALLYDIKNARDIKKGDASIDDLGVASIETYVLEVTFEAPVDVDNFFELTASPALVPLREDVAEAKDANGEIGNWAKKTSTMVTNGPFDVKRIEYGTLVRLERSSYYFLDPEKNEYLDKYVIPYRLVIHYGYGKLANQLQRLLDGDLFYLGEIPLGNRAEYQKDAKINDTMVTHTYYFNTANELFSNANVRKALSMALDRNEIVKLITYAKAATGLIPDKVFDSTRKTSFRETADESGALINSAADVSGAKSLLSQAGVSGGSFTLTVRDREQDIAVAEYVQKVWQSLGFTVTLEKLSGVVDPDDSYKYIDEYYEAYSTGDFDVIAVDMRMLSTNAFSALAPFALEFSGNGVDFTNVETGTYDLIGHVTGYNSSAYNALIEKAYTERDIKTRAATLHEAEKQLLSDMPVMPLVFLQDAYLYSKELSGIKSTYYGVRNFNDTKLKNYMKYKSEETQVNETLEDGE